MNFIETYTGRRFQPLAPQAADIYIGDIAHALSQQCRFSGHTKVPYSVAEHSVRVSKLLESWGCEIWVQRWGLLHDASEAYLVDLPTPLKRDPRFTGYREAERELMAAVCERFDLWKFPPDEVAKADAVLLRTEARDLMPYRPEHWGDLKVDPLQERIFPWGAMEAESRFLERFVEVCV